ncbi:MAG: fatty acid desaturase [Myxococcales bacterium]|nr:fatty acid desaturase [Myxococcales bacterium]
MFGCFAIQLSLYFFEASLSTAAIVMAVILPAQQLARACLHFHYHCSVFVVPALNRLYEVALFFCTGLSPHQFTLHHVLGHHVLYFNPRRDPLGWQRADGAKMTFLEFLAKGTVNLYRFPFQLGPRYPRIFRRFKRWLAFVLGLLGVLVALDPARALIIWVIPMVVLLVDIIRLNWWHHVGLEASDHARASRNDLRRAYNIITFNSGYHTVHHIHPGKHWSLLAAEHQAIAHTIPDELNQGSTNAPDVLHFGR